MPASTYYGPEFYVQEIKARVGISPFGDPLYRVVQAGKIIVKKTLRWTDWDESTDIALRDGIVTDPETGRPAASPYRPLRSVTERREVERYPDIASELFVMERWWPQHVVAPEGKAEWNAPENIVEGTNDSRLGEFPQFGDYEMVVGPFKNPPSLSYVMDFIAFRETQLDKMERDVAKRIRDRTYEGCRAAQAVIDKRAAENHYRIRDSIRAANSSSLAAGRWRTAMAERMGYRSHIGN